MRMSAKVKRKAAQRERKNPPSSGRATLREQESRFPDGANLPSGGTSARAGIVVALVCALVLLQGGYYAGATCAMALVSTAAFLVWSFVRKERMACSAQTLLVCGLACVYLLSSLAHGATATELLETAAWFSIAGMSLWCAFNSRCEKRKALEYMAWMGVVGAIAGILMFFGVLPVEGSVSANRLMFTFQYANTAGLFFGLAVILCLCVLQGYWRIVAVVPAMALLLTQSVGALAVFAVALVAVGIRWAYDEKPRRAVMIGAVAVAVGACLAGVLLLHDRLAQAASTFVERFVQVLDAASLFASNLLLGVGPDQWQVLYPAMQTAQYRAASVHCSYMQAALDGGVLALALLVAFFVVGIVRLAKSGDFVSIVCASMIAAHALADFDLQFSSVVLIACLVLAVPQQGNESAPSKRLRVAKGDKAQQALCLGVAACALVASAGGIYLDGEIGVLQERASLGDGASAYEQLESKPYLRNDPLMQGEVAAALFMQGDYESAIALATDACGASSSTSQSAGLPTDSQVLSEEVQLYLALSKLEVGESDDGREVLENVLYQHSYDVSLYQVVRAYLTKSTSADSREACIAVYNEQAARANALAHEGHAAWIGKQEEIELIGSDDA